LQEDEKDTYRTLALQASAVVESYNLPKVTHAQPTRIWVYHYVSESVFKQVYQEKTLKSPYVMFQEYMSCSLTDRAFHPWKRVHYDYLRDAANWINKKNIDVNTVRDADIYAYLVWRASSSFGQYDYTAGPKAINFSWAPMPENKRDDAVVVDEIIAADTQNPYLADRYARVIYIDLMKLINEHGAKIYHVEGNKEPFNMVVDSFHWLPATVEDAAGKVKHNEDWLWANFETGRDIFQNIPHGCVVLNKGSIPLDCMHMVTDEL